MNTNTNGQNKICDGVNLNKVGIIDVRTFQAVFASR